jgi:hypothetical protein
LLPNGEVFQIGANGVQGGSNPVATNTALYNPSTNSWSAGPVIPNGKIADDNPAAVLPDGNVLFSVSSSTQQPGSQHWAPPVEIDEYNPNTNTITQLTLPSSLSSELATTGGNSTRMLVLPNGQIAFADLWNDLWLYFEPGTVNSAWAPAVTSVVNDGGSTYTLTGTQLNGMDEGASFGDDWQMAENYPIVQITTPSGRVLYATTSNWSSTAVATGSMPETVQFSLPSGLGAGSYTLHVIADGIASSAYTLTVPAVNVPITGDRVPSQSRVLTFTAASTASGMPGSQGADLLTITELSTSANTFTLGGFSSSLPREESLPQTTPEAGHSFGRTIAPNYNGTVTFLTTLTKRGQQSLPVPYDSEP